MDDVTKVNKELQVAINGQRHELEEAVNRMCDSFQEYKRQMAEFEALHEASEIVAQDLRSENEELKKRLGKYEFI